MHTFICSSNLYNTNTFQWKFTKNEWSKLYWMINEFIHENDDFCFNNNFKLMHIITLIQWGIYKNDLLLTSGLFLHSPTSVKMFINRRLNICIKCTMYISSFILLAYKTYIDMHSMYEQSHLYLHTTKQSLEYLCGINNVLPFIERKKILYLIIHNCTLHFIQKKDDKQKSKSSYYWNTILAQTVKKIPY